MKRFCFSTLLWLAALLSPLHATQPAGKTQQLTSPDQVPEGLAKSDWSSIRAAYEAGRHAFQPTPTGWQARNPGQQWTTSFDRRGFVATPKAGGWTWGLELQGYGFGNQQQTIAGTPAVQAVGSRLTYQWDAAVQEWFVNDQRGLEHGFTVSTRPAADTAALTAPGAQPPALSFLLAVRGGLRPHVTTDALGVEFRDAAGATVLNYAGLKVWDADGKILTSHFELAASSPSALGEQHAVRLLVDERDARYPITIDPIAQQAYLKASNTGASDWFGISVAVSGDTVVVGAMGEASSTTGVNTTPNELASGSGAVYVFVRSGTTWTQQAYLKGGFVAVNDNFGASVAISGDTVVVGANGEDGGNAGVNSPYTVGVGGAGNSGAAYVFVRSGTSWSQQAYLKAHQVNISDNFGGSVAVSGDTVVVGANGEDSNTTGVLDTATPTTNEGATDSGAAYVFVRSVTGGVTAWTQQAYLKAHQVDGGDSFGTSVAISGETVVVGATLEDSSTTGVTVSGTPDNGATNAGAAYVFTRSDTTWTQQAYLKAVSGQVKSGDQFGASVAVDGNTLVVGAPYEDGTTSGVNTPPNLGNENNNGGAAYVFLRSGTTWTQEAYLKPHNTGGGDFFGNSVAVSGDTVVVAASGEDSSTTGVTVSGTSNDGIFSTGAAYVFVRNVTGPTWTQQAYLKAPQVTLNDFFGISVAVSGSTVVVGAYKEDGSSVGVNNSINESALDAGAAYIFIGIGMATLDPPTSVNSGATTATLGGNVISDGGAAITARGFVYAVTATNPNPQIGGTGVTDLVASGTTTGAFTIPASGLTSGTGYTYAAYATTSAGTTYSTGTFTAGNQAPTLTAIAVSGTEDTTLTFTAANFEGTYNDTETTPLASITIATLPATGTLKLSGTDVTASQVISAGNLGNLTYEPAANENGAKTFTVTASDGTGSSGAATVTMTLTAVNDAPTLTAPATFASTEDVAGNLTFTGTPFADVDSATLTVTLSVSDGTITGNTGTGITVAGTATARTFQGTVANLNTYFTTADKITYLGSLNNNTSRTLTTTVSDGSQSASTTSTITITAVNDAPTLAAIAVSGTEDTTFTFTAADFTAAYADVENTPLVSITIATLPATGALQLSSGAVTAGQVIPAADLGDLTYVPALNANGAKTFTVTASDGGLSSAAATVTLTLAAVNDAPTLTTVSTLTGATEDTAFTISYATLAAAANAADVEGDTLSFRVEALTTGTLTTSGVAVVAGTTLLSTGDSLVWTPAGNANGTLSAFTIKAWDGTTTSATAIQVQVTVAAVNDAPTLAAIADTTTPEDTATSALAFTIGDVETAAASLTVTATSSDTTLIPNANLIIGGSGASRTLTATPALNEFGTATITVTVNDGTTTTSDTFVLTVTAVNDAPTLAGLVATTTAEDTATAALAFTIGDVETAAAALTVTATSSNTALVPNAALVFGGTGASRTLTATPALNEFGTATITVTVNDGTTTTSDTFVLTVTAVNDAPTLTTVSTLTGATEDTAFTISYATLAAAANAADVEGDTLSFRVEAVTTGTLTKSGSSVVAGTTLLGTGDSLVWTPAANANATLSAFTIKAWDGTTTSATAIQVQVTVTAVNDVPVAGADTLTRLDSTRVTKVLLTTLLANDTDPENDTLSITAVGSAQPVGATVSISGRFAVYVAPGTTSGNGSFTYTLSDGTALVTSTVTVTETSSSAAAGSPNYVSLVQSGSDYVLKFLGVPGSTYGVQYTTATGLPYTWNEFPSPVRQVAPDSGVMSYTDLNPPGPIRLYRAVLLQ